MAEWNERRLPRMRPGCCYLVTGLLLVGAILAGVAAWGVEIAGRLAGIG